METNSALNRYLKSNRRNTKVITSEKDLRYAKMRALQEISVLRTNQKFFQHVQRVATTAQDAAAAKRGVNTMKILINDHRKLLGQLERYDVKRGKPISLFPLPGSVPTAQVIRQFLDPLRAYAKDAPIGFTSDNRMRTIRHRTPVATKSVDEALADVKREFKNFQARQKADKAVPISVTELSKYTRFILKEVMVVEQNKIFFESILERARMEKKFVKQTSAALAIFQKYVNAYKVAASVLNKRPKTLKTSLASGAGYDFAKASSAFFKNVMRRVTRDGNLGLVINRVVKVKGNSNGRAPSPTSVLSPKIPSFNGMSVSNGTLYHNTSNNRKNGANAAHTIYELRSQIMQSDATLRDMKRQLNASKMQTKMLQNAAWNSGGLGANAAKKELEKELALCKKKVNELAKEMDRIILSVAFPDENNM